MFNIFHVSWKKWAEVKAETFLSSEEIIVEKLTGTDELAQPGVAGKHLHCLT